MISVCMATYNGEKFIKEQLESILKQLASTDEVIISDDGSTDNTIGVITSFGDNRIKLFFNEEEHGFTRNFENALKHASGDYIFLSDQDDVWLDNKVDICLEFLKNADLVISDCKTTDANLKVISNSRFKDFHIHKGFLFSLIKSRYIGCCMAFNTRILKAILPFPDSGRLIEHDIWISAVGELYFRVKLIREPLILYRRHETNTSNGGFKLNKNLFFIIKKRIIRIYYLVKIRKKIGSIKNDNRM